MTHIRYLNALSAALIGMRCPPAWYASRRQESAGHEHAAPRFDLLHLQIVQMARSLLAGVLLALLLAGGDAFWADASWPMGSWQREVVDFSACCGVPVVQEPEALSNVIWEVTSSMVVAAAALDDAALKRRAVICAMVGPLVCRPLRRAPRCCSHCARAPRRPSAMERLGSGKAKPWRSAKQRDEYGIPHLSWTGEVAFAMLRNGCIYCEFRALDSPAIREMVCPAPTPRPAVETGHTGVHA